MCRRLVTSLDSLRSRLFGSLLVRLLALGAALLGSLPAPLSAAPPENFYLEELIGGLNQPTSMRFLPDGRLIVLQKKGEILICDVTTNPVQYDVYMDFRDAEHLYGIISGQERGVLDIAVDPNFPAEPYVYVFYTPASGPNGALARVARYTHLENAGGLSSRGDYASEVILWEDTDPYNSCCHYGGGLDFGPDGKLWLTTGDHFFGAYADDVQHAGGGVHRFNKDGSIPADNPYIDGNGPNKDSTVAYGLRNPFRSRWDLETNRFFIAEVGGNAQDVAAEDLHIIQWDEASGRLVDDDFGTGGDNGVFDGIYFGWPTVEGMPPYSDFSNPVIDDVGAPIFSWKHNGTYSAINGGVVYRKDQFPVEFNGAYFYADSTRDFVRYIKFDANGNVSPNPAPDNIDTVNPDGTSYLFDPSPVGRIVSLDTGPDGALYYLSFTDAGGAYGQPNPSTPGSLRRYVYDAGTRPVIEEFTAAPVTGESPVNVSFTLRATDAGGDPMTYTIDFGDGTSSGPVALADGVTVVVNHSYSSDGSYTADLEVSDGVLAAHAEQQLAFGTPPTVTSLTATNDNPVPDPGFFRYGDTITFAATATDSDDNPIDGAQFDWSVQFVRPGNVHPSVEDVTGSSFEFPIPAQGQGFSGGVFYRCFLVVTDNNGLKTTETIDVFPEKVNILFDSEPSGMAVGVNGNRVEFTPFVLDTLVNYDHVITIEDTKCIGGTQYDFVSWSNGPTTSSQMYVAPVDDVILDASFVANGSCTVPPGGELELDGLVLQLESSQSVALNGGSLVAGWLDDSGTGNDFVASGDPQFGAVLTPSGLPAVSLDGDGDLLERVNTIDPVALPAGNTDRTVFMVARHNAASNWAGFTYGNPSGNQAFGLVVKSGTGELALQGYGGGNDLVSGQAGAGAGWVVQSARQYNGEATLFEGGTEIAQFIHNYNTQLGRAVIGEELGGAGVNAMDVAAVLVYDRALNDVERFNVENYLESKYLLNTAPQVTINAPLNGATVAAGASVAFSATAVDFQDGPLSDVEWSSNIDGALGTGETINAGALSTGTHTITATASDSTLLSGSDSITLTVSASAIFGSLEAIWPLDETTGTLATDMASDHDGTLAGGPTWVPDGGQFGGAIDFAGGAQRIDVPSFDVTGDELTLAAWVKPESFAGYAEEARYISKASGTAGSSHFWMLGNYQGDKIRFRLNTAVGGTATLISPAGQLSIGEWAHVAATYDGATMKIFVNGVQVASQAKTGNISTSGAVGIGIGNQPSGAGDRGLIGLLDEPCVFSASLEPADIAILMSSSAAPNTAPEVVISSPGDGAASTQGSSVSFAATATDGQDGNLSSSLSWSSDLDGVIGSGASFSTSSLSVGSHVITASVSDSGLLVGADSVMLTIVPAGGGSGAPFSADLVVALEATDGVGETGGDVEYWVDQSGFGNNLTPGGDPTIGTATTPSGLPAISLDGNDKMERENSANPLLGLPTGAADRTMFLVANYTGSEKWAGASYGSAGPDQGFGLIVRHPSGELVLQGYGSGNDLISGEIGIGAGWLVQSGVVDGGTGTLFKDGVQVGQIVNNYNTGNDRLVVGEELGGLGHVTMDVAAVLIYNRALDSGERAQVESYLQTKYLSGGGGNTAPTVAITSPGNGTTVPQGLAVNFAATADDTEDGDLSASLDWVSSLDGAIGGGAGFSTNTLSVGTHTITASVSDSGFFSGSDSITLTVEAAGSSAPFAADLVLALEADAGVDASGSAVNGWADQSASGNDLLPGGDPTIGTATTPTGIPAISLDGNDRLERINASAPLTGLPTGGADRTMFVVANYLGSEKWAGASYGTAGPDQAFGLVVRHPTGELALQGYGSGNDLISGELGIGAGWLVQSGVVSGTTGTLFKDGAQIGQYTNNFNTGNNRIVIGQELGGLGYVTMDVAAVLVYDRALDAGERAQVESYLQAKYLTGGGGNTAPAVAISSPADGSSVAEDSTLNFAASATDAEDGDLSASLAWVSDLDGPIGSGAGFSINTLSVGTHVITASVSDSGYLPGSDSITLTVDPNTGSAAPFAGDLALALESDAGVDASGSAVNGWADQSGNGNDLLPGGDPTIGTTTTPTGAPAISLDGDDLLERVNASDPITGLPTGGADRTIYLVANYLDSDRWAGASYGATGPDRAFGLIVRDPTGELVLQGYGSGNDLISGELGIGAGWLVQSGVVSGTTGTLFKDGVQIGQYVNNFNTGNDRLVIGDELGGLGHVTMDVAALLIYDRALDAGERAQVESYLQTKYLSSGGGNTPPLVSISSPGDGASVADGASVDFAASATDAQDGDLSASLAWVSNLDGPIGSGAGFSTSTLSNGTHVITASVSDSGSLPGSDTVTLVVGAPANPDLVAKWSLDEISGTTASDQVGGHDATLQGGPVWRPSDGQFGGALEFGGGAERAQIPAFDLAGDQMTIATWVKPASFAGTADEGRFVSKASSTAGSDHYWMLGNYVNGTAVRFRLKTANGGTSTLVSSTGQLELNQWHHVAATYDGANMRIFVDGDQVAITAKTGAITANGGVGVALGNQPAGAGDRGFAGSLDDVVIFSAALDASEIQDLMTMSTGTLPNSAPTVAISSPAGGTVNEGATVNFVATADDTQDGDLSSVLAWTSNLDGPIGSGASFSTNALSVGTHQITASVTDSGALTGSDVISLTVQTSTATSTAPFGDSLALALETDAGVATSGPAVTGWADQSGFGNDLMPGGDPTIGTVITPSGLPAIRLDGNDFLERMDSTDPITGLPIGGDDRTIFLVANYLGSNSWAGVSYGSAGPDRAFGLTVRHPTGELVLQGYGSGNDLISGELGIGAGWLVQSGVVSGTTGTLFKDGAQVGQYVNNFDTGNDRLVIGDELGGLGQVTMDVAAVLVYNRALDAVDRAQVEAYLQAKYLTGAGGNTAPVVAISSPGDGASVDEGATVNFAATATDTEDGDLSSSVSWVSSIDGSIGSGASFSSNTLSAGTHTITASVNDSGSLPGSDQVTLVVGEPTNPDLVSKWPLDEASGTIANDVVGDKNGSLQGATSWSPAGGRFGGALEFTGGADRVQVPAIDFPFDKMTVATWVKPTSFAGTGAEGRFVSKATSTAATGHLWMVGNYLDGTAIRFRLKAEVGDTTTLVTAPGQLSLNEWTHVAATYDGEHMRVFVNGTQVSIVAKMDGGIARNRGVGVALGNQPAGAGDRGMIGFLDDVHVFSAALDASEITDLMNSSSGSPLNTPPNVAISSPAGGTFNEGATVNFSGTANDAQDGEISSSLTWVSNLDGPIGTGANFSSNALSVGTHQITATATDSGSLTGSAQVSVTVQVSSGTSTAPFAADLALALESDGGVDSTGSAVNGWADQSGNGNDLFPGGDPTIGTATTPSGVPAISLDGDDLLERVNATHPINGLPIGGADRTIFLVANYLDSDRWAGVSYGSTGPDKGFGLIVRDPTGELVLQGYGSGNDLVSGELGIGAGWLVQSGVVSGTTGTLFKDGAQIGQYVNNFNTANNRVVIGDELGGLGHVTMDVAAVLVYTRALDAGERAQVENYLQAKYFAAPSAIAAGRAVVPDYPQGYEDWLESLGIAGAVDEDSDQAGLDNLSEYLLGLDASDPADDASFRLEIRRDGSDVVLTYPELVPSGNYHLRMNEDPALLGAPGSVIDTVTRAQIEAMKQAERELHEVAVPVTGGRGFFSLEFEPDDE